MALIKCPECGTEVSDKAKTCIKCGCPIAQDVQITTIRFEKTFTIRYNCTVICESKEYNCKQGESVEIPLTKSTTVDIKISGCGHVETTVQPGKRYSVETGGGFLGTKLIVSAY